MIDTLIPLNSTVQFNTLIDFGRETITVIGTLEGYIHESGIFKHEESGELYERAYFYYSVREITKDGFSRMHKVHASGQEFDSLKVIK